MYSQSVVFPRLAVIQSAKWKDRNGLWFGFRIIHYAAHNTPSPATAAVLLHTQSRVGIDHHTCARWSVRTGERAGARRLKPTRLKQARIGGSDSLARAKRSQTESSPLLRRPSDRSNRSFRSLVSARGALLTDRAHPPPPVPPPRRYGQYVCTRLIMNSCRSRVGQATCEQVAGALRIGSRTDALLSADEWEPRG